MELQVGVALASYHMLSQSKDLPCFLASLIVTLLLMSTYLSCFVAMRRMAAALPSTAADVAQLRKDFKELKLDIEDILAGQNDINEDTRMQLELINQTLAALQTAPKRPRRPIGFNITDDN